MGALAPLVGSDRALFNTGEQVEVAAASEIRKIRSMQPTSSLADVLLLAIACAATFLVAILVLWAGFKLLLLPLRIVWRVGSTLGSQVGLPRLTLILIWTIALEPGPFTYFWGWLVQFGQALLVDAPRQFLSAGGIALAGCAPRSAPQACFLALGTAAQQIWSVAISQPISTFKVPPHLERAVVFFAIGATIAAAAAHWPAAGAAQGGRSSTRTLLALTASFLLALYLSIVAIVATPVFGQKAPELAPISQSLDQRIDRLTPREIKLLALDDLKKGQDNIPDIASLGNSTTQTAEAKILLGVVENVWASQLDQWKQSYDRLQRAVSNAPEDMATFKQTAVSFFQFSNEGYIGENATQRHAAALANSYVLWIAAYRAGLDACAGQLREGLGQFHAFYSTIAVAIPMLFGSGAKIPTDQLNQAFQKFAVTRCGDLKPPVSDFLPARSGPAETLGPFGAAAAWLLRTESPELALIIGLLGFGFFGALAASFVREFAGTPGNQLPSIGFIVPALIRGIGAAILVFLVAKGGMAVFTKGEATPNAYAVFFACFVGAVFSEDVWSWARSRQQAQLAGGAGRESTADSKAEGDGSVRESTKDHSGEMEASKPS